MKSNCPSDDRSLDYDSLNENTKVISNVILLIYFTESV